MGRERREAHRDRLLVADVGQDLVEDRERRLVRRRPKAALVQHGGEAECLQRDGLPARVRAADDERAQRAELEIDRHGGRAVEERVPGSAEDDIVAFRHKGAAPAAGERSAREHEVELGRRRRRSSVSSSRLRRDERREVAEDPRHLVPLGHLGLTQAVRVLDGRERLYEERLSRAGRVVDDPGHTPAGRRLQREHGTARPLRHEVVLEVLAQGGVARDLPEALGEAPAALAQLAPQAAQRRRGRVAQVRAVLLDRAADLLGDRRPATASMPATSSARAGRSSRPASARRAATPARIVRATCVSVRVSRVPPRAASSAASVTSAAPPRSGSPASSRSAIASVVCCCRSAHDAGVGRREERRRRGPHPARSPPHRRGAPGRPGARAARDRARAWRECTAAATLSPAPPSRTIRRNALPEPRCRSSTGNVLLTDGGMETTLVFLEGLELPCFASFPLLERRRAVPR